MQNSNCIKQEKIKIYCKNNNKTIDIEGGSSLSEIFENLDLQLSGRPLCAIVNNRTENLGYRVYNPKDIEYADVASSYGMHTYIRTLCFILCKAVHDIMPDTEISIEHSISKGVFCLFSQKCGENTLTYIKERMIEIIDADMPIIRKEVHTEEVIEKFRKYGKQDKVALLSTSRNPYTVYYTLDDVIDTFQYELAPSTGYTKVFDLVRYSYGFLLIPPSRKDPSKPETVQRQDKLLAAFEEQTRFNNISGLQYVGEMNIATQKGKAPYMIKVMEALHEKQIGHIADDIVNRFRLDGSSRIILIAGPSSSGKTTFSKRLSIQIMTNLIYPIAISLDNYFVERENTPRDKNGDYDYESINALDLELFNKDLNDLLEGKEINLPTYNFETGTRSYEGNTMALSPSSILILEGIHALNPDLTAQIEERLKFRIYVSALTSISIDKHNWIPTTDNRLLRRIIRDSKYRGSSAQETIARWKSVREGEEKWIFPYQENADAMFNTSLIFELSVICRRAIPLLSEVPRDSEEYNEARRLLNFLKLFLPIQERDIPPTSLAREFLGGSSFKY